MKDGARRTAGPRLFAIAAFSVFALAGHFLLCRHAGMKVPLGAALVAVAAGMLYRFVFRMGWAGYALGLLLFFSTYFLTPCLS